MPHSTSLYSPNVNFSKDVIVIKDNYKKLSFEREYIYPHLRNMVIFFYEDQLRSSFDNIIHFKFNKNPFFKDSTIKSINLLRENILQVLHSFSSDIIFPETILINVDQYKSTVTLGDNLYKIKMHFECLNDFFNFSSNFLKEEEKTFIKKHNFSSFVIWLKDLTDQIQYVDGDNVLLYEKNINQAVDYIKNTLDK